MTWWLKLLVALYTLYTLYTTYTPYIQVKLAYVQASRHHKLVVRNSAQKSSSSK